MSEIVIRHIEARDAEALRDIMSHPGVYHDTLQLPHPSMDMWHDRVATKPGRRHLVACLDQRVVGHMALDVMENPRRSHVATFGISVAADVQGRGVGRALMREMVNLCDNWLRIERIELTVLRITQRHWRCIRSLGLKSKGPAGTSPCVTATMWTRITWRG